MAVTSLWAIKKTLNKAVDYAKDKNKTLFSLETAIDYASNKDKTEESYYVTGINCNSEIAVKEMQQVKDLFNKTGGILGFHGYQSFNENEVTPEVAHEIGIKLATEMWGDKYQVLVTTHLNTNHIHNHFVINSVSFIDGKKFNSCRSTTAQLRNLNDCICKEYGLSSLEEKITPKGKIDFRYYLKSDREHKTNYYDRTKNDIDLAIRKANDYDGFLKILKDMNYEVVNRYGKLSVRNLKYNRYIRIERHYGDEYTIKNINRRIVEERENDLELDYDYYNYHKKITKSTGIVALYRYYCYLLKIYPKKNTYKMYYLKEDVDKLEHYNKMIRFFDEHNILTDEDLVKVKIEVNKEYDENFSKKKTLRKRYDRTKDSNEKERIIESIREVNNRLNSLKEEIDICNDIELEKESIQEKIQVNEKEKIKE